MSKNTKARKNPVTSNNMRRDCVIIVLDDGYVTSEGNERKGQFRSQKFVDALLNAGLLACPFDGCNDKGAPIYNATDCADAAVRKAIKAADLTPERVQASKYPLSVGLLLDLEWWGNAGFGYELLKAIAGNHKVRIDSVLVVSIYAASDDPVALGRIKELAPQAQKYASRDYAQIGGSVVVEFFKGCCRDVMVQ